MWELLGMHSAALHRLYVYTLGTLYCVRIIQMFNTATLLEMEIYSGVDKSGSKR